MKALIFCVGIFCSSLAVNAQGNGCTDPQAINFNPAATVNDGSCQYAPTQAQAAVHAVLPNSLSELSGLGFACQKLWGHNDGGQAPVLFGMDAASGAILDSLPIPVQQIDWEDACVGPNHLFIGDFGNNTGQRDSLAVLRIPLQELCQRQVLTVDTIAFSYADQPGPVSDPNGHDRDCESMAFFRDSLVLLTKNRNSSKARWYRLPAIPGHYALYPVDSTELQGQATGLDVWGDSLLVLVGYTPPIFSPFLVLGFDFGQNYPWQGNWRRLDLGTVFDMGQLESVVFTQSHQLMMGSEAVGTLNLPPRLYAFSLAPYVSPALSLESVQTSEEAIHCAAKDSFWHLRAFQEGQLQLFDLSGRSLGNYGVHAQQNLQFPVASEVLLWHLNGQRGKCLANP